MATDGTVVEGGDKSGGAGAGEVGKPDATVLGAAAAEIGKPEAIKVEAAGPGPDGKPTGAKPDAKVEVKPFDVKALKFPEGFNVNDKSVLAFAEIATKNGISTEAAQALVDFNLSQAKQQSEALDAAWKQESEAANARALETLKKDPELGGSAWKASQQHMKVALEKFGTPALRELFDSEKGAVLLDGTKLGNVPELARLVATIGKALTEDNLGDTVQAGNGKARTTEEERLRALYPKSPELFAKE